MPYLVLTVMLMSALTMNHTNQVIDSLDAYQEQEKMSEATTILNELSALHDGIEKRRVAERNTSWKCIIVDSSCSGEYDFIIVDDGYVDEANWKSELIPGYVPFLEIDDRYTMSLYNETDILRICINLKTSKKTKDITKQVIDMSGSSSVYANANCLSDVRYDDKDIESESGADIYLISKLVKTGN